MRSDATPLGGYAATTVHYDEAVTGKGRLRHHWRRFVEMVGRLGPAEFTRRWEYARRLLHQVSLTSPDPSNPTGRRRPWELDPYPLILPTEEWRSISAALVQRATLLDTVLRDLYGPQQLIKRGVLPAEAIFRHPGFRMAYCGQEPPLGRFLHFYAADLTRSPDGKWEVSLFANNLLDTQQILSINPVAPVSSGNVAGVFARPASGYQQIGYTPRREFGLNIRYAFGAR